LRLKALPWVLGLGVGLGAAASAGGCALVLGLDEFVDAPPDAGTTGAGAPCQPGETQPCYGGPDGTEGIGLCREGQRACVDGVWAETCEGEVTPRAEDCTSPGDEDCDGAGCSETFWAKIFGDGASQSGMVVAADASGGVIVAGATDGTVDFGGGPLIAAGGGDVFVARFDRTGKHAWSKRFGDANEQVVTAVAVDAAGNVFLSGYFEGSVDFGGGPLTSAVNTDVFLAKLDPRGQHVWSERYGSSIRAQEPSGLAIGPDGHLVLVGSFWDTIDFGGGELSSEGDSDVFTAKLDSTTGAQIWAKSFGDPSVQQASAVDVDASGNIVMAGSFGGAVSFGGAALTTGSASLYNMYVVKLDTLGNHAWSKQYGDGSGHQRPTAVKFNASGEVIVAGEFAHSINFGGAQFVATNGHYDIYVAKLSSSGQHVWSRKFGGAFVDRRPRIALNSSSDLFITCQFEDAIDFGGGNLPNNGPFDIAVARLDPAGQHVWSRSFGDVDRGLRSQFPWGIAGAPTDDAVFITGQQFGTVDYGQGSLAAAEDDIFVLSLAP